MFVGGGGIVSAQPQSADEPRSALSERDARILEFERQWWRHVGAKEEAIRSQFSLTAARYYQLLNAVIDSPAAVQHDPMLVRRLLRARDARTSARSARAFRTARDDESNE
jgi:hypothetical protein